jgi:hypothetical protein
MHLRRAMRCPTRGYSRDWEGYAETPLLDRFSGFGSALPLSLTLLLGFELVSHSSRSLYMSPPPAFPVKDPSILKYTRCAPSQERIPPATFRGIPLIVGKG